MTDAEAHRPGGIVGRIARSQGLILPWSIALVLALATAFFGPTLHRWEWFSAAAGISVIIAFAVQLIVGRTDGFILRTATAALGSIVIVGIVSLVAGLFAAVASGLTLFPAEFASP